MRSLLTETCKQAITDSVIDFIALDMRPLNMVKGARFRQLMKTLEPGYIVPKRDTVTHTIMAEYDKTRGDYGANETQYSSNTNRHLDITEIGSLQYKTVIVSGCPFKSLMTGEPDSICSGNERRLTIHTVENMLVKSWMHISTRGVGGRWAAMPYVHQV